MAILLIVMARALNFSQQFVFLSYDIEDISAMIIIFNNKNNKE